MIKKIQKPIPKTHKKGGPELKKTQIKIAKTNSTKGFAKKVKQTLALVDANDAEKVKTNGGDLNKKKSDLLDKMKETVVKKKPFAQKSKKNVEGKKSPGLQEESQPVENIASKKNAAVANKHQQPKTAMISSDLDEMSATVRKSAPKAKPLEAKLKQAIKKSVKKSSASGGDFENDKKKIAKNNKVVESVNRPVKAKVQQADKTSVDLEQNSNSKKVILKKKKVVAKVQQPVKIKLYQAFQSHVSKKNSALEIKADADKKEPSQKMFVAAKEQQRTKKSVTKKDILADISETVNNVIPKKKVKSIKNPNAEQKYGKKLAALEVNDKLGKEPLQKKSNSKVQKKLSAGKKNDIKLKNKIRKNASEVKNIVHKDQNKIVELVKEKPRMFEPTDFDEDKFKVILSLENIKKVFNALKTIVGEEVSKMKHAVFSDYALFLNVASYKIPNCPKRMVKLNLKHGLVDTKLDDVVLIVSDLKRGAEVDYEPTIQHYDDILRLHGIENIKVMPFNQLRKEYKSFEAKRKLSNIYDHFLCDGRIVGQVVGFCGKNFQKARNTIHAVNLSNPKKFKNEIERALKRTAYRQLEKGDLSSILVGNHRFTADQLAENIETIIHQLKTIFPGGYANIRNMHIRTDIVGTSALPLYVNLAGPPDDVPNIIGPREQRMLKLKKEANEVLSKFNMAKTGDFVKLNKTQVKRKQDIRETREALTSKENIESKNLNSPSKKPKKQVEPENSEDDSEVSESDNINGKNDQGSDEDDDEGSEECSEDDDE